LKLYFLAVEYTLVYKDDVVKYMLPLLILKGRIGKWILAFSEFDLTNQLPKVVKGQVMADLVTQHCGPKIAIIEHVPWTLYFDRSSCGVGARIRIILFSPGGKL
jgi:hypothetical protein